MEFANINITGGFAISGAAEFVTANLIQLLDAANSASYSGSGSTWYDISGQGYNGTISGPTYSANNQGYFNFSAGNYISLPGGLPITNLTEMTWNSVAYYSNVATAGNPGKGSLFSSGAGFTSDMLFSCYRGDLFYQINDGGDGSASITLPSTDTWLNLCLVFNGNGSTNADRMKLYINGVLQTLSYSYSVPATTPSATGSVEIGRYTLSTGDGDLQFVGRCSVHALYNRALTQAEVTQNFDAVKDRYGIS